MMTVAQIRIEKNIEEARKDYANVKKAKLNQRKINSILNSIEKEKESIIECLDQNFFSMAKSYLNRIEEMNIKIIELRENV